MYLIPPMCDIWKTLGINYGAIEMMSRRRVYSTSMGTCIQSPASAQKLGIAMLFCKPSSGGLWEGDKQSLNKNNELLVLWETMS